MRSVEGYVGTSIWPIQYFWGGVLVIHINIIVMFGMISGWNGRF